MSKRGSAIVRLASAAFIAAHANVAEAQTAPSAAAATQIVLIHIDAPSQVELQIMTPDRGWRPVCTSPCDQPVPAGRTYRIGGGGVRASSPFLLEPGARVTMAVDPSSAAAHGGAIAVTVIGVAGLGPGVVVTAGVVGAVIIGAIFVCPVVAAFASKANQGSAYSGCIGDGASYVGQAYGSPYVWGPALVGGVALATGITLLATSHRTRVQQSPSAAAAATGLPSMWRTPGWRLGEALPFPRPVTTNLIDLSF